jgi:hypothetical protein
MDDKSNRLLIGIIILLLGVFSLLQNTFRINYTFITITVGGMAFLLLYRTKRKGWSLVLGSYLTYIGMAGMLGSLPWFNSFGGIAAAMFFVVPGIIFMVLFFDKRIKGLLVPGSLLVWFGLFVMMAQSGIMRDRAMVGMFFVCIGLAFVTMYVLGKTFIGKFPLYFGLTLVVAGFFAGGGFFGLDLIELFSGMMSFGPVALIAASLVFIVSAFRKKE